MTNVHYNPMNNIKVSAITPRWFSVEVPDDSIVVVKRDGTEIEVSYPRKLLMRRVDDLIPPATA